MRQSWRAGIPLRTTLFVCIAAFAVLLIGGVYRVPQLKEAKVALSRHQGTWRLNHHTLTHCLELDDMTKGRVDVYEFGPFSMAVTSPVFE